MTAPNERVDWTDGPPSQESEPAETAPPLSAEDLKVLEADDDDVTDQRLIESGAFTAEELAKYHIQTVEKIAPEPKAKSSSPVSIEDELKEIATLRRTDKKAYFADDALQARERELIAMRDKLQAAPAAAESEAGEAGEGLDPQLLEEWDREGGIAHHLQQLQATAQAVISGVDPDAREAFTASFDALPQTVQHQVYRHLAVAPSGVAQPASPEILAEFASESDERAAIAEQWGDEAPAKLGLVRARTATILGSMSDDDQTAATEWLDALPEAHLMAVVRALSEK